jgi:4-hydroxybenzoate polyprenyltransferase/geranylgeranylglycerol-phosphate geranylgeranyltransferase
VIKLTVSSHVGQKILAHIEMSRPYTVIWCGLVSLTGASLIYQDIPPIPTAVLVTFIPMMGWIAGLYLSDYLDQNLDKIQKPHRPIPSGRINPMEALGIGGLVAISGFLLSFLLGLLNVLLVIPVAILVFMYGRYAKSRGILGNIFRGLVIMVAYFYGIIAINQTLADIPISLWLFSLVFLLHDNNSNLIGAIRDIKGDKEGGYHTIPVKYGIHVSLGISVTLSTLYTSLLFIFILKFQILSYPWRFFFLYILSLIILSLMFIYLVRLRTQIDHRNALRAHEFMIAERITLASAVILGISASFTLAIGIFVVAITLSLFAQYALRKKYEFRE